MNKPMQEFNPSETHHRLVAEDGRATHWAPYKAWTYLDGWVGVTAYWEATECVLTAGEFAAHHGVGECNSPDKRPSDS